MKMYEINYLIAYGDVWDYYLIAYGDVWDYLFDCSWRCMILIIWLLMEMYEINYLIAYGDVWD